MNAITTFTISSKLEACNYNSDSIVGKKVFSRVLHILYMDTSVFCLQCFSYILMHMIVKT